MLQTPSPFALAELWREALVTSATASCQIAARTTSAGVSLWSSWLERAGAGPQRSAASRTTDRRAQSWYRAPDERVRGLERDDRRAVSADGIPAPWSLPTPPWSLTAFLPRPDEMRAEGPWMAAALPWLDLGHGGAVGGASGGASPYAAYRTAGGHASAQIVFPASQPQRDAPSEADRRDDSHVSGLAGLPFAWMLQPWLPR